jgi:sterol O-acyltransferase
VSALCLEADRLDSLLQVMIMKMHSYMVTNGQLHTIFTQSQGLEVQLRRLTQSFGGWDQAISDAKAHKAHLDELVGMAHSSDATPNDTPEVAFDGTSTTVVDAPMAAALRQRLVAASARLSNDPSLGQEAEVHYEHPLSEPIQPPGIHTLVDHPNEEISALAKDLSELKNELRSNGPKSVQWPNNITYKDFAMYQLTPTLVYELEYPRTDRWVFLFITRM